MLFDWFRKKKKNGQTESEANDTVPAGDGNLEQDKAVTDEFARQPVKVEKGKVNINNATERVEYLQRLFEGIQDAKRQCADIKFEYGQVTSYLKDIQLLDQAPEEEKATIILSARRIVELQKEREYLQSQRYEMTDAQRRSMENFEPQVNEDIQKLREYEDYQMKIKNDLRQLSSEKNLLLADKQDIIDRQGILKSIGKILMVILIAFGTMMLALRFCFKVDITVPFIATAAFAFVIMAIILNEARKNRIDMVITEKKCNRAIFLSNRVKLKYFNNVRTLDYMMQKYHVRNAAELEYVFGQYRRAKREWERQRESSIQLNESNQVLIGELKRLGVKDTEIWFTQAGALIDSKEMVEVRHDLNVRRQKLREQLDYNTGIVEECMEEIGRIRDADPEYAKEVKTILSNFPRA